MAKVFRLSTRPRHDQVNSSGRIPELAKRFDQQIAAFLFVKASKKKKEPLATQIWERVEESVARAVQVWRRRGAVVHDHLLALVAPEGFAGQTPFLLGSEKHSRRITQNAILGPGPVQEFFNMFRRIGAFEPGIEHAMWENKVGRRTAGHRPPHPKAAVVPDAVDNDGVVLGAMYFHPARKT